MAGCEVLFDFKRDEILQEIRDIHFDVSLSSAFLQDIYKRAPSLPLSQLLVTSERAQTVDSGWFV